jgi:hypothetical protein
LKVFFDEDVPRKLARSLPQHEIHIVVSIWQTLKFAAANEIRGCFRAFVEGFGGLWPHGGPIEFFVASAVMARQPGRRHSSHAYDDLPA